MRIWTRVTKSNDFFNWSVSNTRPKGDRDRYYCRWRLKLDSKENIKEFFQVSFFLPHRLIFWIDASIIVHTRVPAAVLTSASWWENMRLKNAVLQSPQWVFWYCWCVVPGDWHAQQSQSQTFCLKDDWEALDWGVSAPQHNKTFHSVTRQSSFTTDQT